MYESDEGISNPTKVTGWSTSGGLVTGNAVKQVSLQANFPRSGNYTLQFGLQPPPGAKDVKAEALITWSVEGNSVTRRVSVGNGTSVSGTGQGVKVVMSDVSSVAGLNYSVSVQVAPGTRPSTQQPPVLVPTTSPISVDGGAVANIAVPADCGAISVFVTAAPVAGTVVIAEDDVRVVQNGNATVLRSYDPRTYEWVPLAPGTVSIQLQNNLAAGTFIRFSLSFGIDG